MVSRHILITILVIVYYALGTSSGSSCSSVESRTVRYDLQEEGVVQGRSFRRYVAVDDDDDNDIPLTTIQWTETLQEGNVASLNQILADVPYNAYYFETKPVTNNDLAASCKSYPFEFVLIDAPSLVKRKPRFRSFEQPCNSANGNYSNSYGCGFPNLSGDAILNVPKPQMDVEDEVYTHLATFIRKAPTVQVEALWKFVATSYQDRWSNEETTWLSTAGNGVPWLHFRLDSTPKYYRYIPYKTHVNDIDDGEL